jgi:hypothetical protein
MTFSDMMIERDQKILDEQRIRVRQDKPPLAYPALPTYQILVRDKTLDDLRQTAWEMDIKEEPTYDGVIGALITCYRNSQAAAEDREYGGKDLDG